MSGRCKYFAISLIIRGGADVLATSRSGQGKASGAGGTAHTSISSRGAFGEFLWHTEKTQLCQNRVSL